MFKARSRILGKHTAWFYFLFNCVSRTVFVGTGRLVTPHLISEVTFSCESSKSEFTSRHNLDWKFLALDSRATPIIGYVQLEVVGTSGYDYYHVDDLDKLVSCHEACKCFFFLPGSFFFSFGIFKSPVYFFPNVCFLFGFFLLHFFQLHNFFRRF